jgi:hypothetical protein
MATENDNDPTIGSEDTKPTRRAGPHAPLPKPSGIAGAQLRETSDPLPETPTRPVRDEEDPRIRAARRAAEILENRGSMDEGDDEFFIDPRIIPEGWSYEWKRHTILNKEDPSYQVQLARGGWEGVPAFRHPEMMPQGYEGHLIERKGMILMERPMKITQLARDAELRKARSQVRQKEAQLHGAPAGENSPFDPTNKGTPMVKIAKSYEPMPIPKE